MIILAWNSYSVVVAVVLCALRFLHFDVTPDLMEGFGLMKSFRGIIQNQLLFEGFGIMKSFWDRN